MTISDQQRFAEVVWDYDVAGGGDALRRHTLDLWGHDCALRDLHVRLLLIDLLQFRNESELGSFLTKCQAELSCEAAFFELCQMFFSDACEADSPLTWSVFATQGYTAEQLHLRCEDDECYLGEILDKKYQIERRIGAGTFGTVYLATDLSEPRLVAIKCVKGASKRARARSEELLRKEGRSLAALAGGGFPRVYGKISTRSGAPAIVMEYIEGQSIAELCKGAAMPRDVALAYFGRLVDNVEYLHRHGWIHRDIKPDNVIVSSEGRVYLLDLGMALIGDDRYSSDALRCGTPGYMAPEVAAGRVCHIDERSDIFSLGAVLFEMLTGRRLFTGSTWNQVVDEICKMEREGWLPVNAVPVECRDTIVRCLKTNSSVRFFRASDVAAQLRYRAFGQYPGTWPIEWDCFVGWRLGKTIGIALENALWIFHLSELLRERVPTDLRALSEADKEIVLNIQARCKFVLIAKRELGEQCGEFLGSLHGTPMPLIYTELVEKVEADATAVVAMWLLKEGPGIVDHLTDLWQAFWNRLSARCDEASSAFALASESYFADISGREIDLLDDLHGATTIPGVIWGRFKAGWQDVDRRTEVWLEFSRAVERHYLFRLDDMAESWFNPFIDYDVWSE